MSRAPLALALLLVAALARAQTDAQQPQDDSDSTDSHAALADAACGDDSPALLVKEPGQTGSADSGSSTFEQLPQGDGCADAVADLPDDAQIALRPAGAGGKNPTGAPTDAEYEAAFKGPSKTVGQLSTDLSAVAQRSSLEGGVAQGRQLFDNASAEGELPAPEHGALVSALRTELKPPQAAQAPQTPLHASDFQPVKTFQTSPAPDLPSATELDTEYERAAEPGTTVSDIPGVGRLANRYFPSYSDVPLNPWRWPSSPPSALSVTPNPSGIPASAAGAATSLKGTAGAPIWEPFTQKLKACRPDCRPQEFGIWRPSDPTSCHYSGAAIDLHSIRCGDTVYRAIDSSKDSGPFADLVTCMRSDKGGGHLFAIWHQCFKNCAPNKTAYHMDHTHLSIGCGHGRK